MALIRCTYMENHEEKKGSKKGKEGITLDGVAGELYQPPFDPNSPHLYELFAVIIHGGGAYGGHYRVLVRYFIYLFMQLFILLIIW